MAFLFRGDFDGNQIVYNRKRYYFILLMECFGYLFFFVHIIVFITDDEYLRKKLVYLRLTDGFGYRFINLGGAFAILFMNMSLSFYRSFSKYPEKFNSFFFLFSANEKELQKKFHLDKSGSKRQMKLQRSIFIPVMKTNYIVYTIVFFLFVLKLSADNLLDSDLDFLFFLNILLYFLLFLFLRSGVMRILVNCFEIILGSYLLTNHLRKLKKANYEIARFMYQCYKFELDTEPTSGFRNSLSKNKSLNKKIKKILIEYNSIITRQYHMNLHLYKSLTIFIIILIFSVIYPSLLLFGENKSIILIVFYISNYIFILIFFYPMVHFNYKFITAVRLYFV